MSASAYHKRGLSHLDSRRRALAPRPALHGQLYRPSPRLLCPATGRPARNRPRKNPAGRTR